MAVRTQLLLGFGALVLVTVATGATAVFALRTLTAGKDQVAQRFMRELGTAESVRFAAEHVVSTSRGYLLTGDPRYIERYHHARATLESLLTTLEHRMDEHSDPVAEVERAAQAYVRASERAIEKRKDMPDTHALVPYLEDVMQPARDQFDVAIQRLVTAERGELEHAFSESRMLARKVELLVSAATSLGVLLSLGLAVRVTRRLSDLFLKEQRAAHARDDILAVVSHDLRNPLSAILMGTTLLQQRLEGAQLRQAGIIRNAADRMKNLIEELLDVARIEGGAMTLRREQHEAACLIEDSARMFETRAVEKGVALIINAEPGALVWADSERILQVLSNLIGNALKFTPSGGAIEVEAARESGQVRFSVRDTGPGIAVDQLPHLFERQWQGQPGARQGLGLGLYIAKTVVEAHGGRIWVESTLGKGSSFFFILPAGVLVGLPV